MKEVLTVAPERWDVRDKLDGHTSIYVRAQVPPDNRWESVDIILLDLPSLMAWLRSRGGDNRWAENTVALIGVSSVSIGVSVLIPGTIDGTRFIASARGSEAELI